MKFSLEKWTLAVSLAAGLAAAAHAQSPAGDGDVSVRITTGDLHVISTGDGAKARIDLGGAPQVSAGRCRTVRIETGHQTRIAIGRGANASIQLPAPNTCPPNAGR